MIVIEPSYEIMSPIDGEQILKHIELCGRVCYKSEGKISEGSAKTFVNMICNVKKHNSVLEHYSISVKFTNDRGFSHELVRHRIASFSQESQRYCAYAGDKFSNQITFINPTWFEKDSQQFQIWKNAMIQAELYYLYLIKQGAKPEEARGVLPNDTKTEVVITANLREWIHIFNLRCSKQAHPTMHRVMKPLLKEFQEKIPVIFDDVTY